jgi:rSAM/selenodomain-associated transferase 1
MPGKNNSLSLLVLMAKKPVPGQTKTRLIPALGEECAAGLYAAFLQDKVAQMRLVAGVARAIAHYPPDAQDYFSELAPDFSLIEQRGNSLAERLANLFNKTSLDGYANALAIDGDTPHLPIDYLQSAFETLDDGSKDVVIGPCEDGGYYAIGLKQPNSSLFDVEMSTPFVTRDTMARAEEAGLTVHLLPEWWDVDELPDLKRLERQLKEGMPREARPLSATQDFLAELQIS